MRLNCLMISAGLTLAGASVAALGEVRCATPPREFRLAGSSNHSLVGAGVDCSATATNADPSYDPGPTWLVPVVVHLITNTAGTQGFVSDATVAAQIQVLNEDFRALAGTNGANGTNAEVVFFLRRTTRSANDSWYDDADGYWNSLASEPDRALNIYVNSAGGSAGYVPFLPADPGAGVATAADRIVVPTNRFGPAAAAPNNLGRTLTHLVGHALGLEHTFFGGCAASTPPDCATTGDLICDTNPEADPFFGCASPGASCGFARPADNYMNFTEDACLERFTVEQVRRMRCTIFNWRSTLGGELLFVDNFESGNTTAWSVTVP